MHSSFLSTVALEIAGSLEMLCTSQTTRRQIPEDSNCHSFKDMINLQDRQFTYNMTMWHIRLTIVATELQT
jgi:hypothetical protein